MFRFLILEGFRDWAPSKTRDPSSPVKVPTMLRSPVIHDGIARLLRALPKQFNRKFRKTRRLGGHTRPGPFPGVVLGVRARAHGAR